MGERAGSGRNDNSNPTRPLFSGREITVVTAALLHFGAFCGASPPSDVTAHSDGWQCEEILRRINPYAADELAAKLVPRIDTGYSRG